MMRKFVFIKLIKFMAKYMTDLELRQAIYYLATKQQNKDLEDAAVDALL